MISFVSLCFAMQKKFLVLLKSLENCTSSGTYALQKENFSAACISIHTDYYQWNRDSQNDPLPFIRDYHVIGSGRTKGNVLSEREGESSLWSGRVVKCHSKHVELSSW